MEQPGSQNEYKAAGLALVAFMVAATVLRVFVFWWCYSDLLYRTCLGVLLTGTGFTIVETFDIVAAFDAGDIKQASDWVLIIDVFFACYQTKLGRQTLSTTFLVAFASDLFASSKERGLIFRVLDIPDAKLSSSFKIILAGFAIIDWLVISACLTCCANLTLCVPTYYLYARLKKTTKNAKSTPTSIAAIRRRSQGVLANMYAYGALAAALLLSPEQIVIRLVLRFLNVDLENHSAPAVLSREMTPIPQRAAAFLTGSPDRASSLAIPTLSSASSPTPSAGRLARTRRRFRLPFQWKRKPSTPPRATGFTMTTPPLQRREATITNMYTCTPTPAASTSAEMTREQLATEEQGESRTPKRNSSVVAAAGEAFSSVRKRNKKRD